jgi:hypothetical protein
VNGNRCGHDRRKIRRRLCRGGGSSRQPLVLVEGARAFARAIVERPHDFPDLSAVLDDHDRARRSERLEAIGLVVMALVVRADLLTLVVKWRGEGLPQELIAKWTGMSARRVRRALHDLRWAGFARGPGRFGPGRIAQPVEAYEVDGETRFRGKVAIRQLDRSLWESVGMGGWLKDQQARRYADLARPRPRPMSRTAVRLNREAFDREARMLAAQRPPPT